MSDASYKLRCTIYGHTCDVRALIPAFDSSCGLISASRDRTVRIWTPLKSGSYFSESQCLKGASHYISSLCALLPSSQYPSGVILAGSNDCCIYGFLPDVQDPVMRLEGHTGTVSSLGAGTADAFVSGSWDYTARVWHGKECKMVLKGHQEAVWAVAIFKIQGDILTGSADKTIRLWRDGKCETTFTGHELCVRGLAILSETEFLSCSNDHTVRLWSVSGDCIGVFTGHEHYIYSIALLNERDFVTSSEDTTIKIWSHGECVQTIKLPSLSLWAVACLENGDIAVGGSDNTIRVFTKHKNLMASDSEIEQFEQEIRRVESSTKQPGGKLGDLDLNDIHGLEVLATPGQRDGQTILCREGDGACAYQWSAASSDWIKIGDIVGANDPKKKTTYKGREYDYVFTIDIDEGKYLSLPYNVGEDPWEVAQSFIHEHGLSQEFLTQIVDFIITNTANNSSASQAAPATSYCDPFTGANRYVPGKKNSSTQSEIPGDLLTSSSGDNKSNGTAAAPFPISSYISFSTANTEGLKKKLIELNGSVTPNLRLTVEEIEELMLLVDFPDAVTERQLSSMDKLMGWPEKCVYPALDLFRLAVRSPVIGQRVSEAGSSIVINYFSKYLQPDSLPVNTMLAVRAFCNFFGNKPGESLLAAGMEKIFSGAKDCIPTDDKRIEIAVASLFLNYSVALNRSGFPFSPIIIEGVVALAKHAKDPEAIYRLLVCMGTLWGCPAAKAALKLSPMKFFLQEVISSSSTDKVTHCAKELLNKLD